MSRYIDADDVIKAVDKHTNNDGVLDDDITCILEEIPTAEVKPIVYATLLADEDGNIKCSNCGNSECWGNYCMNCGAKMI